MAIVYDPSTNIITVTGYSEETPCNFTDVYDADKAGTYELLDGTIDADPDTFSLDNAVRPTDDKAVKLTITCTARVGATCDIVGEDAWGNALTESGIDISSGSATTVGYFSSVDASGITVDGMTNDDDFDIEQGQWGVVWKRGTSQFQLDAFVVIGVTGVGNETWFADKNKQIVFSRFTTQHWQYLIKVWRDANLRFGVAVDVAKKTSVDGCALQAFSDWAVNMTGDIQYNAISHLYSSFFMGEDNAMSFNMMQGGRESSRNWNSILSRSRISTPTGADYYRLTVEEGNAGGIGGINSGTFDDIYVTDPIGSVPWILHFRYVDTIVSNILGRNATYAANIAQNSGDRFAINCDIDTWSCYFAANISGPLYRQYTFNLRVVDKTGTGIDGATVTMVDKDGTSVFSVSTDEDGDIAQQTITYKTYDRLADTAGADDTVVTFSPHTVTITKTGYQTSEIIYTMDRKREEIEVLEKVKDFNLSKHAKLITK